VEAVNSVKCHVTDSLQPMRGHGVFVDGSCVCL